jgi:hypothetical protein
VEFPIVDVQFLNRPTSFWQPHPKTMKYCYYWLDKSETEQHFLRIREILRWLFASTTKGRKRGNEAHVLTNNGVPDVFDIIYENHMELALKYYDYFIDLTPKQQIKTQNAKIQDKFFPIESKDVLISSIKEKIFTTCGFQVTGNIHWLINRCDVTTDRIMGLFNNDGVLRTGKDGDILLDNAHASGIIEVKMTDLIPEIKFQSSSDAQIILRDATHTVQYQYEIPAGGCIIIRWHKK